MSKDERDADHARRLLAQQAALAAIERAKDQHKAEILFYTEWRKQNPSQRWTPSIWTQREQ
jgi:hypothetical protein